MTTSSALVLRRLLNRIYWFRKLAGVRDMFKHLLVFEEFHVMSSADKAKGESRIDFLLKMSREWSQGILVLEQNPGRISDAAIGNLNTVISMKLLQNKDIHTVSSAMALKPEYRPFLSRLQPGWAICKASRLDDPVLVKVDYEVVDKSEISPEEIRAHNKGFVPETPAQWEGFEPAARKEFAGFAGRDKLTPIQRKILRYLKINHGANLKRTYMAHGMSYRRGNTTRKRLEGAGFITSKGVETEKGKETRLYLTDKALRYLQNTEDSRRLGGAWHRSAVKKVVKCYSDMDYTVRREYRDMDVFVDKGSEKLAVEVESLSGSKDYVHAVSNAYKALRRADRVEIVVKDKASAKKLLGALMESPVKPVIDRVNIRLLDDYDTSNSSSSQGVKYS